MTLTGRKGENDDESGGTCGKYWGEVRTGFCWGNVRERNLLEDLGINGRITSKCSVNKSVGRTWTRLIWLMIESSGVLL